jgi:hypothetical protein
MARRLDLGPPGPGPVTVNALHLPVKRLQIEAPESGRARPANAGGRGINLSRGLENMQSKMDAAPTRDTSPEEYSEIESRAKCFRFSSPSLHGSPTRVITLGGITWVEFTLPCREVRSLR